MGGIPHPSCLALQTPLTSLPPARILPCTQEGGPLSWFLPPLVLRPHRTDLQVSFGLWRLPGQQEQLPFGKKSASLPAIMCKVGLCEAVLCGPQ